MSSAIPRIVVLDAGTTLGPEDLGNKGASIARMLRLGLRVPPAFVLPIEECRRYRALGGALEDATWERVLEGIRGLEEATGRRFGDPSAPLLVSVRSGAAVSMPGMMDTVLNLGMNDAVEAGLGALAGDPGFARSTHARFIHGFGNIVLGADLEEPGPGESPDDVRAALREETGRDAPPEPADQLRAAIHAVFDSWSSRRAVTYRRHWNIDEDGGTAVIVQAMVFGNLGDDSGTGVFFTRDPLSGDASPYGEWLPRGQGEDVVSGTHDCLPLDELAVRHPEGHAELLRAGAVLERENGDVQDIEFTIERGRLYLLQTRSAKRSPAAALRIVEDLVDEGVIDHREAVARIPVEQVAALLAPRLAEGAAEGAEVLARGVAACPGVAAGRVALDSAAAAAAGPGEAVLARPTTSPEDVGGMIAACAVVTERGGATSHAAVVSRALGRPSVVGVGEDVTAGWAGREVTVDGSAGVVYAGVLPTEAVTVDEVPGLGALVAWAREVSPVAVVADAPEVLDLDALGIDAEAAADVAQLAERLLGAPAVAGAVVGTEVGARAVLEAGVPVVVPRPGQSEVALVLRLAQARLAGQDERG